MRTGKEWNRPYNIIFLLPLIFSLAACVTAPMQINPVYATRSAMQINGEIEVGTVNYPEGYYGSLYSLGAVELSNQINYFCVESLKQELGSYGFTINENAPIRIDATIKQAETVWRQQGQAGVFNTTFALEFRLTDQKGQEVYRQIHQGSATHSQSYGGYPASASVVDALATVYERFLLDAKFQQVLIETRSINLYGKERTVEKGSDYKNKIYRDYQEALDDMSPDILASLEPIRYDGVIAIFGFKNKQGERSNFSLEIEREIRGYLSKNRFNVVTRELADILHEQKLQYTGLFDENIRAEIGKFIGATHLVSGSLYYYDSDGIIKLRVEIINVETGLVSASFVTNLIASQGYLDLLSK